MRFTELETASLDSGRDFHLGVAPSWNVDADFTSAWRLAGSRAPISLRRGAELESGRRFYFTVSRRARFRTRIPPRRRPEVESGRGFYLVVAPSWNLDANFTSPSRRAGIQALIPLRCGAEQKSGHGFYFGLAPSWHLTAVSTSAYRPTGIQTRILLHRVAPTWIPDAIPPRRRPEKTSGRGFHFGVEPRWHPRTDSSSAWL